MAAIVALGAASCGALQLLAPTEGEAVREYVKIVVPAGAVPDSGFISILMGDPGSQKFVEALSRDTAKTVGSNLVFYWNTKTPYYDSADPSKPRYFKDGRYPVKIQVHDGDGVEMDSATVNIELKNRVARTNPAPGIRLVNKMSFGQSNQYHVHSDVSFFEMVNGIGLPMLGGMGLNADSVIFQSVEDVRPDNEYLLRLRQDEKTYISSYGVKNYLFAGEELKPQLYRLVTSHGKVVSANMFAKQAKYQIMDLLPSLPSQAVKEGDSWPDSMTLKIDGLTGLIKLKGSAMLDSFEWQNGHECAKVTSMLTGNSVITLVDGKVQGAGPLNAEVTTYFAYKSGRMLLRHIMLSFDAAILGTIDNTAQTVSQAPAPSASPYADEQDPTAQPVGRPGSNVVSPSGTAVSGVGVTDNGAKKGKVEFDIVVRLEK